MSLPRAIRLKKCRHPDAAAVRIHMPERLTGPAQYGGPRSLGLVCSTGAFDFTPGNGPTCSRCLKPLVCHENTLYITATAIEYSPVVVRRVEWHCPDRCASVAARWKKAFEMLLEDWFYPSGNPTCSRCGMHLLATRTAHGRDFWCPGCGPVE